jgi:hypothetical protein
MFLCAEVWLKYLCAFFYHHLTVFNATQLGLILMIGSMVILKYKWWTRKVFWIGCLPCLPLRYYCQFHIEVVKSIKFVDLVHIIALGHEKWQRSWELCSLNFSTQLVCFVLTPTFYIVFWQYMVANFSFCCILFLKLNFSWYLLCVKLTCYKNK